MVSLDSVEEGCTTRLQALGGGFPKQLQKGGEVPRLQALEVFQGCSLALGGLWKKKTDRNPFKNV